MFAQELRTDNTSGLSNTKEYIVLHHTATDAHSLQGVLRHLTKGPVSCHYVIDTSGDIYKINSDDDVLRHCGDSTRDGRVNLNDYSIGIEVLGPLPGFTDQQRVSLRNLVSKLMYEYQIPADHIIRHKDIAPGRKSDPDDSLRNTQYTNFAAYQQSFATVQQTLAFYKAMFLTQYGQAYKQNQTLISDIDSVVARITRQDGTINTEELVYLLALSVEKLHAQFERSHKLIYNLIRKHDQ